MINRCSTPRTYFSIIVFEELLAVIDFATTIQKPGSGLLLFRRGPPVVFVVITPIATQKEVFVVRPWPPFRCREMVVNLEALVFGFSLHAIGASFVKVSQQTRQSVFPKMLPAYRCWSFSSADN